jgi:hypothetical protein
VTLVPVLPGAPANAPSPPGEGATVTAESVAIRAEDDDGGPQEG